MVLAGISLLSYFTFIIVKSSDTNNTEVKLPKIVAPKKVAKDKRVKLVAVGDMLIHDTIYNDFRIGSSDTFDFRPAFQYVKPIIEKADFAAVNEETPLGGVALGLSGLYVANSPQELGDALADTGFNLIQLANNHTYDRRLAGIEATANFWQKYKSTAITSGAYLDQASRDKTPILEKNGIKLAFLNYTYGSNLGNPPNSYNLNLINRDLIAKDIAMAKTQADVIVVAIHWGIERDRQESASQRDLAQFLANQGADIIYGTHPHVLQPPEWLTRPDGKKTYCMYSLGNFLSIHTELIPHTLTGAIMGLGIVKNASGKITLENPNAVLTWNYYTPTETGFRVIPFSQLTQSQYRFGDVNKLKDSYQQFLSQRVPEITFQ